MNYNNIFNVDYRKFSVLLTPIFWRKVLFVAYIYCFIEPIKTLHNDFKLFRRKSIYKIVHNGQVILLEKVLNDAYDPANPAVDDPNTRRIYITDSIIQDPLYIYSEPEARPVFFGTQYFYTFATFDDIGIDFYVVFPLALRPVNPFALLNFENQIKATVNYYKLASKRYKIIWL